MRTIKTPLTTIARRLRTDSSEAERRLWYRVRDRRLAGYKFRRQFVVGRYVVDFVCVERRLVVELDGGQHSEQTERDEQRTRFLEEQGFRVRRFWNNEVLAETEAVLSVILDELKSPSP